MIAIDGEGASIHPAVWGFVALLFVSAILLIKKNWWACILGISTGVFLIYMGTQHTGQILNEKIIGVILCVYYLICGIVCYIRK